MDDMRSFEHDGDTRQDETGTLPERPPQIGSDERRMHVRAYNFWVSLLGGRAYPSIEDLEPEKAIDFGPHSVLLDFTSGTEDPAITYLGESLRRECGVPREIETIADVPSRSLLSRLTDHYLQILANRAPIGFEAEFVSQHGDNTLYRGILMPFSSDDDTIDFVYGVINWKIAADVSVAATGDVEALSAKNDIVSPTEAELAARVKDPEATVFADGPSGGLVDAPLAAAPPEEVPLFSGPATSDGAEPPALASPDVDTVSPGHNAALADHLITARDQARVAQSARLKSRASLYRALGFAHDFSRLADARPEEYSVLLRESGIRAQPRAPMTAIIKLIFGANVDKARATEFAATLSYARRLALEPGTLSAHLDMLPGGLKAMVAAERLARRPVTAPPSYADIARAALRKVAPQAMLDLPADGDEFVLLLARREGNQLAVIAPVPAEASLVDRAIRKVTR